MDSIENIKERIQKVVAENLNVEDAKITDDAKFTDDLGADSLDQVELIMAFEEEFNIEISDEDAEKIRTIKDAITYIHTKK